MIHQLIQRLSFCFSALLDNAEPVYAEVDRQRKHVEPANKMSTSALAAPTNAAVSSTILGHRRHLSACNIPSTNNTNPQPELNNELQAAVESLALLPVHIRRKYPKKPLITSAILFRTLQKRRKIIKMESDFKTIRCQLFTRDSK